MARSKYSHTSLLKDVKRDEDGRIVSISPPYGSADIANNGDVLSVRYWDKNKEKQKTQSKTAVAPQGKPKSKPFPKR